MRLLVLLFGVGAMGTAVAAMRELPATRPATATVAAAQPDARDATDARPAALADADERASAATSEPERARGGMRPYQLPAALPFGGVPSEPLEEPSLPEGGPEAVPLVQPIARGGDVLDRCPFANDPLSGLDDGCPEPPSVSVPPPAPVQRRTLVFDFVD
jgi:hypothetical protein